MNKKTSIFRIHAIILIYSLSTVFAKFAGMQDFLSARFLVFATALFVCLAVYALLWQKVLGDFALSVAYANRAADLLWGIVFGCLFFGESITLRSVLSAAIVFAGIFLVLKSDE